MKNSRDKARVLKLDCITPQIVHIKAPDAKILASAMCRFQEHYESPFPEIRNQIFTLGQLRAMGSRHCPGIYTYEGGITFDADWSGYNFPSHILDPFIKGLFDPLTDFEQDVVNMLKCKQGKFYVIGTYGTEEDDDPSGSLDHEICHALYYIDDAYRHEVDASLKKYTNNLKPLKKMLIDWGYDHSVLDDECHAYISADFDWLKEKKAKDLKKFNVVLPEQLHKDLRKLKNFYFKEPKK